MVLGFAQDEGARNHVATIPVNQMSNRHPRSVFFPQLSGYDSMRQFRVKVGGGLIGMATTAAVAISVGAQALPNPMPLKYVGPATKPAITAGDLMTRLYKYADDSMMGRDVGTLYHHKAVAYIESEVRRLGLKPGGTNGSYYQDFPIWLAGLKLNSALKAGDVTFPVGSKFIAIGDASAKSYADVSVVYGGIASDTMTTLDSAAVAGKIVLLAPLSRMTAAENLAMTQSSSYKAYRKAIAGAAGTLQLQGDSLSAALVKNFTTPQSTMTPANLTGQSHAPILLVTTPVVEALFGAPLPSLTKGQVGKSITTDLRFSRTEAPVGRNVVAILEGTDPKLKGEYIAIGGHSDHIGFGAMPVVREHDSLRVWNAVARPAGAEGGRNLNTNPITPEEWAKINADIAALRKIYPPRPDSINNGADDDGSGSVSVLEIAEAFAKGPVKPKRSIIFVWHAGEEHGMWGSGYFMDNPTIPRDSIVAQLNIDMVGRGAATDVTGQAKGPTDATGRVTGPGEVLHGGDRYLQLVGSRRLSTELGDLVEKVNKDKGYGFNFDYNIDADGHQQNIYCRSDHWSYGKWGVPVVFFTTGGHADYHQVTDEPQYIRYEHMARVDNLIFDIALAAADLDHRVVVDKAKPNPAPATSCKQ